MTSERGTFFRTTLDDERDTFYGERSPVGWHGPSAEQLAAALEAQCSALAMGASGEDAERQQAASLLRWQSGEIQALRAHVAYFAGLRAPEAQEQEREVTSRKSRRGPQYRCAECSRGFMPKGPMIQHLMGSAHGMGRGAAEAALEYAQPCAMPPVSAAGEEER